MSKIEKKIDNYKNKYKEVKVSGGDMATPRHHFQWRGKGRYNLVQMWLSRDLVLS